MNALFAVLIALLCFATATGGIALERAGYGVLGLLWLWSILTPDAQPDTPAKPTSAADAMKQIEASRAPATRGMLSETTPASGGLSTPDA